MDEIWYLNTDDTIVIGLGDNSNEAGVEREMWILSHLDYPLVYVIKFVYT